MRTPLQTFRLNQKRKAAGFTQAALASRLGVTQAMVSRVISGQARSSRIEQALSDLIGSTVRDGKTPRANVNGRNRTARKRKGRGKGD